MQSQTLTGPKSETGKTREKRDKPIPLVAHEGQEVQLLHMTPPGAPLQLQLLRKEYPVKQTTSS